jgi:hypothetical protein
VTSLRVTISDNRSRSVTAQTSSHLNRAPAATPVGAGRAQAGTISGPGNAHGVRHLRHPIGQDLLAALAQASIAAQIFPELGLLILGY